MVLVAELGEGAFGKQFAGVDDADGVTELFDFAHDVGREDDRLAAVTALADEGRDGAGGDDVEAESGLIEDHDRGIVDESAGDGGFLFHAGGKLVAAAIAETVHVEAVENVVDALLQSGFVQTVEAAEIFDQLTSGETGIESGGSGEETDARANFFRGFDDVVATNDCGAVGRFEDGCEHAKGGGFTGAVGAEETIDFAGLASEADIIHGTDFAPFFVLEALGQATSLDHWEVPR